MKAYLRSRLPVVQAVVVVVVLVLVPVSLSAAAPRAMALPLKSPPAKKPKTARSKPLFQRMGGRLAISKLVDRFVTGLANNPRLMANPALAAAKKKISLTAAKRDLTDSLCQATGGPCKLGPKAFAGAPTELQLAPMEWAVVLGEANQALQSSRIPPKEQEELVTLLLQYKNSASRSQPATSP